MLTTNRFIVSGASMIGLTLCWHLALGASFDCTQARSTVEKLVCSDPVISRLDEDLALAYRASVASNPQIRAQQSEWLRGTREQCQNTDCLVKAYKARIQTITGIQETSATGTNLAPSAPADVVPGNANSNSLSFLIDAKAFIGSPGRFQENYWGDPKGEIFGKSAAEWTDQDFQILEKKLQEQIDIERKVAADRMQKVGLKGSPEDDSIFSVYKRDLEKAIAEIPKFKYWTGLSRERLRENEARQQAQEQQRIAREQQQQQESVQRQNQQMAMEQQRQATSTEQRQQQYVQNRAESDRRESENSRSNNLVYAIAAMAVAAGAWFWNKFIRNRCPKCKSAGYETVSATEIDRWLGNKTVHEKHSRGTNTRNVRTTYVKKLYEFRCKSCQTTWSKERKEELDGASALESFVAGF